MSGEPPDRTSVTVRYAIAEDGRLQPLYLEALDLGDDATLGGLFGWMHSDQERQRLRTVLGFDLFDVSDDSLHYRSEDPTSVYLYLGSMTSGKRWWIPRPPLVEILDDWEGFLESGVPFEKLYSWVSSPEADLPSDNGRPSGHDEAGAPVTVHFDVEQRWGKDRPVASTDNVDLHGDDRLAGVLASPIVSHERLTVLLEQRSALSLWSITGVFRCTASEVRIWTDDDSDPDDFAVLGRGQFLAMLHDWIAFVQDPVPFSKTY